MEKVNREPKITEVPLQNEERAKMGRNIVFLTLLVLSIIVAFVYKTQDYKDALLLVGILGVITYVLNKDNILGFLSPSKLIIEGEITWKREYSYIEQRGRFRMEEYAWKYWIYLGSVKLEVSESEFKNYNEGDFLRVEKAKRSNIIYSIQLIKKKDQ